MSKYSKLWLWIKENKASDFSLSYNEIKEIIEFGFIVSKTSIKENNLI